MNTHLSHSQIKAKVNGVKDLGFLGRLVHHQAAAEDIILEQMAINSQDEFGVAIMGTARDKSTHHRELFDQLEQDLPKLEGTVDRIINGGGPGAMEISSRVATNLGMQVLEVPIPLPGEERKDGETIDSHRVHAHSLGPRKRIFDAHADVWWGLLPGMGTLLEMADVLQRAQLQRTFGPGQKVLGNPPYLVRCYNGLDLLPPILMVGPAWRNFREHINEMSTEYLTVDPEDVELVTYVETVAEAVELTKQHRVRWDAARAAAGRDL